MRIAIDIDGTITELPEFFRKIAPVSDYVLVLTGTLNKRDIQFRIDQLNNLKFFQYKQYDNLIECAGDNVRMVAKMKGEMCLEHQIDILFEDTEMYCKEVMKISPNTKCFLLLDKQ
jgi:hypothetical protein